MIAVLLFAAGLVLIFVGLAGLRGALFRGGEVKMPSVLAPRLPPPCNIDATPKPELPTEQKKLFGARSCDPHAPTCQACNRPMWLERDNTVITATEAISQREYECKECQAIAAVVVRGRVYSYTVEIRQRDSQKRSFKRFDSGRSQPEEQK